MADHLARHDYDGLDVFLRFHEAHGRWQRAGAPGTFEQWRKQFAIAPQPEHLTCVGLTKDMLARMEARGGTVASHFYVASAEEEVDGVEEYISGCRPPERNENDHCLMACQVRVSGRRGVLLVDSGYHVPRTICVMADGLYPHTGEITMDCLSGKLIHKYELSPNQKFVICTIERTSSGGSTSTDHTCVFIGGRFENPYAFAEYRNIFHTLRSLVRRSPDGRLLSGLYFSLRPAGQPAAITVFWHDAEGERRRCRVPLEELTQPGLLTVPQLEALRAAGRQLRMPPDQWQSLLQRSVDALGDRPFIDRVLQVNERILYELSTEEAPPGWQRPDV